MSIFNYDSTGIDPDAKFALLEDGWYPFRIIQAEMMKSRSNLPMVLAKCKCIDPRHSDKGQIWHYVTFIPKGNPGDGMNVHFRKSIGVPWEGNVRVNTDEWEGKTFMGEVTTEEYNGKNNNKFKQISPIRDEIPFGEPKKEKDPFGD